MLSNLSDFPQLRVSTGSLGKSFSSPDGEERTELTDLELEGVVQSGPVPKGDPDPSVAAPNAIVEELSVL